MTREEEIMQEANKAVFDANAQCCDIMNNLIKEETMEVIIKMNPLEMSGARCIIPIPKGYEFAGVDDDNQKVIFEKIGCQYPKTYCQCCDVLKIEYPLFKTEEDGISASTYKNKLFGALKQLLICRNAYWKIYGERMGLGKPWEPDWRNSDADKHCIEYSYGRINSVTANIYNYILAFPTEEMRDAFYENFKELINETKELL